MTSPFPGMDPYLESPAYWRDFHGRFIIHWSEWLRERLPDHYSVVIDDRVQLVDEDSPDSPERLPDVAVSQRHPLPTDPPPEGQTVVLGRKPVKMRRVAALEEKQRFIRVYHRPDATLITVLELLSPTNKKGAGRNDYLLKRQELAKDSVHLVELDLLLGGKRLPMADPLPAGDYYAIVSRVYDWPDSEVYAWGLREPLPPILIPLKQPDPDVVFDLTGLLTGVYRRARYDLELPYSKPPAATLSPEDTAWVRERVAAWKP